MLLIVIQLMGISSASSHQHFHYKTFSTLLLWNICTNDLPWGPKVVVVSYHIIIYSSSICELEFVFDRFNLKFILYNRSLTILILLAKMEFVVYKSFPFIKFCQIYHWYYTVFLILHSYYSICEKLEILLYNDILDID